MYYCDICDKEFKTEAGLQKHLESHTHKINVKLKNYEVQIEELTKENKNLIFINKDLIDNKLGKMNIEIEQLDKVNKSLLIENKELKNNKLNFEKEKSNFDFNNEELDNKINNMMENQVNLRNMIFFEVSIVLFTTEMVLFFVKEFFIKSLN